MTRPSSKRNRSRLDGDVTFSAQMDTAWDALASGDGALIVMPSMTIDSDELDTRLGHAYTTTNPPPTLRKRSVPCQRLLQVCNEIVEGLDADREAKQIWCDHRMGPLRALAVLDKALHASERRCGHEHLRT